jgi:hypothetical protein
MASPSTSLSSLWGGIAAVSILFGGSWTVFQTQFSNIDKDQKIIRDALDLRSTEVDRKFTALNAELIQHRDVYVQQYQYREFRQALDKRLDTIEQRLALIEQTRPTTGELRGIAENADKQISRILDRLDHAERAK